MTYILRKTKLGDIPFVLSLYYGASTKLKEQGIDQWQNGYPNEDSLKNDILNEESYVLVEGSDIIASAMVSLKPDPNYTVIDGAWSLDKPYAVIHRIVSAINQHGKGIASILLNQLETTLNLEYIRIDTHLNNSAMRHYLLKNGFKECGMIKLADLSDRIAYDKIINK